MTMSSTVQYVPQTITASEKAVARSNIGIYETNTWYLDTINGDDNNSGLSRYSPKRTTLELVNAVKIAAKAHNKLVDLSSSGTSTFVATQWTDTQFPFDDVVCDSINNTQVWVGTSTTKSHNIIGGSQILNGSSFNELFITCKLVSAQSNSSFSGNCIFNTSIFSVEYCSFSSNTEINTKYCSFGAGISNSGNMHVKSYTFGNSSVSMSHTSGSLLIDTVEYYFGTIIASCSAIATPPYTDDTVRTRVRINAKNNLRHQSTESTAPPLLQLNTIEGASLDYEVVIDYIDPVTDTIEILSGSEGNITGKVIELLKYNEGLVNSITGTENEINTTLAVDPVTGLSSYEIGLDEIIISKLSSLITGTKESRSFPLSADESRIIKIVTITDSDADGKWHIDFKIHFKIAQTTLSFTQDQFNTPNHFRFTYDNESCIESWVYNQDTGVSGLVRIVKTATVDNACSYYLVAYLGYSSEAEEIEIVDGHVSGASAEFSNDAYALLSSIIPTDNYYLTHRVRRDNTMSGTGSYYDPYSAKPTQVTSTDLSVGINTTTTDGVTTHDLSVAGGQVDTYKILTSVSDISPGYALAKLIGSTWVNVEEIVESDINKLRFSLANPDYFVKGTTIYGGTLLEATTGDFNTPTHDGYFTGYYNTLNAPPVQAGNPSWFVHHMNSNAGPLYAVQIAYAYTTSIICYERTKINGVWQAWQLRGSGSSVSEVAHISSMDGGGASDVIALQAGSSTQWAAHGVMTAPFGQITPIATHSMLGFIAPQIVAGSFISAIYKVETSGVHSLICESAITAFPANSSWVSAVVSSVESGLYIPANERVYMVIMTDVNGVTIAGKSSTNFNLQPYVAAIKNNMGVLTAAPKTIQWESETNTRPFIYMTK